MGDGLELSESLVEGFGPAICKRDFLLRQMKREAHNNACTKYRQQNKAKCSAYKKAHDQRPEIKARNSAYCKTEEYRLRDRERNSTPERQTYLKVYRASPAGKAVQKKFAATPERQAYNSEYARSPAGMLVHARFRKTPERMNYMNNYVKTRYKNDDSFAIAVRLRNRLRNAMRDYAQGKQLRSDEYGIDYRKIAAHLGPMPDREHVWVIDHIRPCCSFDLTDVEQVRVCFAPQNLRWLKEGDNLIKIAADKKMSVQRLGLRFK